MLPMEEGMQDKQMAVRNKERASCKDGGLTRYHPMGKQSLEEGEAEKEAGFIYCIRMRVPVLFCV